MVTGVLEYNKWKSSVSVKPSCLFSRWKPFSCSRERRGRPAMGELQPFVFLSYARADHEFVRRLRMDLEAQGINVWIDKEALQPGTTEWDEATRMAIRACQAVVLIVSP